MNHNGTLEDLQTIIKGCGFTVGEVKDQEHGHQIRTNEGAIVNWYTSTGKVQVQGKKPVKDKLEEAWGSYTGAAPKQTPMTTTDAPAPHAPANPAAANKKVFVVHGHDTVSREQLELDRQILCRG